MSTAPVLRVHAHPRGLWLVRRGSRQLGVPADLGRHLATWDGTRLPPSLLRAALARAARRAGVAPALGEYLADRLAAPQKGRRTRGPWIRRPLLSASWVAAMAIPLVPVTATIALAGAAIAGTVGLCLAWPSSGVVVRGIGPFAQAMALFLGSILLHELAHAAALLRGGYPPGPVGVGMVFLLPVLWCDVTAVALLPRRDQLRVDLAGPAVQLAAAGALAVAGLWCGWPSASLAATAALAGVLWSLLPFIRSDGFWFLSDLCGLDDLDRPPQPGDSLVAKGILRTYRLLHGGFILLVGGSLAWRLAARGGIWLAAAFLVAGGTIFFLIRRYKAGAPLVRAQ